MADPILPLFLAQACVDTARPRGNSGMGDARTPSLGVACTLIPTLCYGRSWEHHAHRDRTPEKDGQLGEANADGDDGESVEPHEVALAREEVSMLLAEQRKTAALKVGGWAHPRSQ